MSLVENGGRLEDDRTGLISDLSQYPELTKEIREALRREDILEEAPKILAKHFFGEKTVIYLGGYFLTNQPDTNSEEFDFLKDIVLEEGKPKNWPNLVAAPIIYDDLFNAEPIGVAMLQGEPDLELFSQAVDFIGGELRVFFEKEFSSGNSPRATLEYRIKNPDKLKGEGEKRRITCIFTDLVGSTQLSETMDPQELVRLVNKVHSITVRIFETNQAYIDKVIGDGLMIGFNYPNDHVKPNTMAIVSSLQLQEELNRTNFSRPVKVKIGIHVGNAIIGKIGSTDSEFKRLEFTAMGNTVNIASRIQKVCGELNHYILCSPHVVRACLDEGSVVLYDPPVIKTLVGLSQEIELFPVTGIKLLD